MSNDEKDAGPSDLSWVTRREKLVQQAIDQEDRGRLRELAALPGGFGSNEMRKRVWPILLGTSRYFDDQGRSRSHGNGAVGISPSSAEHDAPEPSHAICRDEEPHKEEEQVLKDTLRSFVSYPKGLPSEGKEALQADLQDLIMGVLRKYPSLSYFQGYHDVMSVLYLTYIAVPRRPERPTRHSRQNSRTSSTQNQSSTKDGDAGQTLDDGLANRKSDSSTRRDTVEWRTLQQCAEVVSVCRVRDAMGPGMEAMMAYLRILKRLLRAADPELSRFSSMISPVPTLPFFALSWILTLFSHDVDTLEPIQRMFDFLLSRNPISAIYLAVAILIAKKPQMLELVKEMGQEAMDDPSILHPLFARLPPMVADDPDFDSGAKARVLGKVGSNEKTSDEDVNPYEPIHLSAIFSVADDLMARFPWDGLTIRGHEVLGSASSVMTYSSEDDPGWSLGRAEQLVQGVVVKPGAGLIDEDEEDDLKPTPIPKRPRLHLRLPKNRAGTLVAVGIVLVGIGIAVYGARSGGPRSNWARWWTIVLHDVLSRRVMRLTHTAQTWLARGSDWAGRALAGLVDL